jgi:hypothetical protein
MYLGQPFTLLQNDSNYSSIYMASYPKNSYSYQYRSENVKYLSRIYEETKFASLEIETWFIIFADIQFTAISSIRNKWNSENAQTYHVQRNRVFNKLFWMYADVTFIGNIHYFLIVSPFTEITLSRISSFEKSL